MTRYDFVKVSNLLENFNQSSVTLSGDKFGIRNVVRIEFSTQDPGMVSMAPFQLSFLFSVKNRFLIIQFPVNLDISVPINFI